MKQTLIMMRGLPGSSKTTTAKRIKQKLDGVCGIATTIISTDDFFMVDGEYKFDYEKIKEAHEATQELAKSLMHEGVPVLIVDNTNVLRKYMKPYKSLARRNGYRTVERTVSCQCRTAIEEYSRRNTHDVPIEVIQKMADNWEE